MTRTLAEPRIQRKAVADDVAAAELATEFGMALPRRRILTEPNTLKLLSLLLILVIWQIAGMISGELFLPTPIQTAQGLWFTFVHDGLGFTTLDSLKTFIIGFVTAAFAGVVLGVLGGYFRIFGRLLDMPVTIFWSTPVVALIPLMVLWIGLNAWTQLTIVFLSALFPVIINTQTGVRTVDRTFLDVAAVFGKSKWVTFVRVVIPAAAPHIGSGLRLGVGRAIIGVFVSELFTSTTGLGARMNHYATFFQTANYFAALVVFIVMSMIVTALMLIVTRRWSRWQLEQSDQR